MDASLKNSTKKGIYWTFLNQFSIYGFQFVAGIIMARILSSSDYGIAALPAVFVAIGDVFIQSGFGSAMVRKPKLTESDLSTAFIYSFSVGLLCYIIIFFASTWIADFYDVPVLESLVRVTALTFIWSPLATPQQIILQRKLDFKTPARISFISWAISSSLGIALSYLGYGVWSIVVMNVFASFLIFIQTWFTVKWKPSARWSRESFNYLWGFGNKLVASILIDTVYQNLTPLIIGKYFSKTELGLYNRAKEYARLPSCQGTNLLQQVTFPVLSKLQDDEVALADSYRKLLKNAAFVLFPVMTLFAALAKPFIIILITDKWIDAVILLQIICFSLMWYPIHAINLNLLQVKGRSDWFLKLEIWKKCVGLTVMACTLPFGLIYFVSAGIVVSFITLFINTYYTGKLINLGFFRQMRDLLPTYVLSILIFVVVLTMNQFIDNLWIQLVMGCCVGGSVYLGVAYIFHFSELQDVRYMLKRKE